MTDSITTETGFWTLTDASLGRPLVFCVEHALEATNFALQATGIAPAPTMAEAAMVVEMHLILNNDPEASTLLTHSDYGRCEECGKEVIQPNETGETA